MTEQTTERMEHALARLARGDGSAFTEIVREHQAMVFSMAYHFLHDAGLAEETAQEVFLRLHRNLGDIRSAAHLRLWLRKVTNRCLIDTLRRQSARPQVSLEDVAEPVEPTLASDPMLSERLRRLVASLPEDSRAVVILRFQEEVGLAEIAEILDIPINTVKSRLQRALDTLRGKLAAVMEAGKHESLG